MWFFVFVFLTTVKGGMGVGVRTEVYWIDAIVFMICSNTILSCVVASPLISRKKGSSNLERRFFKLFLQVCGNLLKR